VSLEIVSSVSRYEELRSIFQEITSSGDHKTFHPHPFDDSAAKKISEPSLDQYYIVLVDGVAVGYGMLKGWQEGYDVPSLGIYISKDYRNTRLARMFMSFLHAAAAICGAKKVRLKVYKDNVPAVSLYKSIGYSLENYDDSQYIGFLTVG
jgi:[ribosomal protein S18]-alanine N-acetyltransferase